MLRAFSLHIPNFLCRALLLAAVLLPSLHAQTGSSSLLGIVTDGTGAVVPAAQITVTNSETNVHRSLFTNDLGAYEIPFLAPGSYSVRAEKPGFAPYEITGIRLGIRETGRVNIMLQTAGVSEKVLVQATAPLLTTDSAEIGKTFTTLEIVDLPLIDRNFARLQILTPGTVPGLASGSNYGVLLSPGFIMGGGSYNATDYTIEGADNNNQYHFHNSMSPSVEAIQEVKVHTGGFSAAYGKGGSSVDIALKGGTNTFHGSLFEYHRNRYLNARNAFAATRGAGFRRNQYGGSLGGPILKNKLFFFGSYEGYRDENVVALFQQVPTADQRAGRFPIPITDFLTGQPFPNNTIPASRFSPYGTELMACCWPQPNEGANFFRGPGYIKQESDQVDAKFDYVITERDSLAVSLARRSLDNRGKTSVSLAPSVQVFNFKRASARYTRTISPNLINTLQFSAHRDSDQFTNQVTLDGLDFWSKVGARLPGHGPGLPYVNISGRDYAGLVGENPGPRGENDVTYNFFENLRWMRGRHSIAAGIDVRWIQANIHVSNVAKGLTTHLGGFTGTGGLAGSGLAEMLLGKPFQYTFNPGVGAVYQRTSHQAYFFQDDWKISNALTLNLGLRYEYFPWPIEKNNVFASAVPDQGKIAVASEPGKSAQDHPRVNPFALAAYRPGTFITNNDVGLPRALRNADKNNWAPRVGFAYRPAFLKDSTVRASYAIGYVPQFTFLYEDISQGIPFSYSIGLTGPDPRTFDILDPFARFAVGVQDRLVTGGWIDPNYRNEYMQTWSFNIEKAFPARMVLDLGYQGSRKVHGPQSFNLNQSALPEKRNLYPGFVNVSGIMSSGDSRFDSLQVKLRKELSHGLLYTINYTWSKTLDNFSTEAFGGPPDYFQRSLEWGPTVYSRRHVLASNFIFQLPFGRGRYWMKNAHRAIDAVLGGWQLTGIATAFSGSPLTVTSTRAQTNFGLGRAVRADRIGSGELESRSLAKWFDTSAFTVPPANRIGNAGRGVVIGPGAWVIDGGIFKNFQIVEKVRLQLRCEMYNSLNHVNYGNPDVLLESPNFGRILSAGGPRSVQIAGRIDF